MLQKKAMVAALAAFVVSGAVGVAVVRWYSADQLDLVRKEVTVLMLPYSNTAAAATGRYVARMAGLKAFVESRRDQGQLLGEFEPYAARLVADAPGVRAVQLVRDGRIVRMYPRAGNEGALNLSLRDNEKASVRAGFARVMATDSVTLFGPTKLVQGGQAFVIDQPVRLPCDPQVNFVSMLLDLGAVVKALELPDSTSGLALEVRDSLGALIGRTNAPLPPEPVLTWAMVRGGQWQVLAGPASGWDAAVASRVRPVRFAVVAIVLLVTLLTASLADRNARLRELVAVRTTSLMELADDQQRTIESLRAAEAALAAQERWLRLALAATRAATFELEVATGRMRWSAEFGPMFKLEPGEIPATLSDALAYVDPAEIANLRAVYERARRDASGGASEIRVKRGGFPARWVAITFLSHQDDTGEVRSLIGTITDITERKQLEEQFLHAQKLQATGTLAGGVAHDFNNLLTVILSAAQMARAATDSPGVPGEIRTELDEILAASERASVLTGQLLAFSRRQVVQPRHFDVCDLVGGMDTMLRRLVGERIRVETDLPSRQVPLFADEGQITQVIMNLAVNARDAMPNGGTLRIGLRTDGRPGGSALPNEVLAFDRFAVLTVSDTGTGIDPAIQHLIFDAFFSTKPVGQGTGLGLSMVYGIVMQLGGTVRMQSAVGEGTTFEVYLPLAQGDAAEETVHTLAPAMGDAKGTTVLLAEDEPGLRRVLQRVLSGAGYALMVAEDGTAALAAARAHAGPIDLLVSDVVMPGMGGLELASTLVRERPEMRVLLMSGYPQGAGQNTPVPLTDTPFLRKPFKPVDLLAAVQRALEEA